MSAWRRVALEKLPEFRKIIEAAETPGMLWIDLRLKFEDAYKEPVDQDLAHRVYEYAGWCLAESKDQDIETAVALTFYEHLPINKKIRRDMANHLTRESFLGLKEVFKYHLAEGEYEEMEQEFLKQSAQRSREALREDNKKKPAR